MANIKPAFEILQKLEYNNPSNFLHKNKGEDGLTVGGIYQVAHPHWYGWSIVKASLARNNDNMALASIELHANGAFISLVELFYKENYFNRLKLNFLHSQNTANEIFLFAVNSGSKNAVRKAQKLVGATEDGILGSQTIEALNNYDEELFDMQFDELELKFYDDLIKKKPSFAMFRNGWKKRAKFC